MNKLIYIASDHAGVELKKDVCEVLESEYKDWEVEDLGPFSDTAVDYPAYADKVARPIARYYQYSHEYEAIDDIRGILICGTGIGMCMRANRYMGVNAFVLNELDDAIISRVHNNSNVMCIGARGDNDPYDVIYNALNVWLMTAFSKEERHHKRVKMLNDMVMV